MILPVFSAYGIEIEYMIVNHDSLDVMPLSDEVLKSVAGEYVNEVEQDAIAWSNEVVLHVLELKTNGPVNQLHDQPQLFSQNIEKINSMLRDHKAQLMPTAMHPWMDPHRETRLWPHDASDIYDTYNRIFDCRGHGWSNLQSMHINLPFADDNEFAGLHSAIRVLLPVLPALACSSPVAEGDLTGFMDTRLETYRRNAEIIPSITGLVVPEAVTSQKEYEKQILQPMYRDIAAQDPDGILQYEWLNSRGAIARFDRNSIEIRVLDTQECPSADIAVAALVSQVLQRLYNEHWSSHARQLTLETEVLAQILLETIKTGEQTIIDNRDFLDILGFPERRCDGRDLWHYLYESVRDDYTTEAEDLCDTARRIIETGPLARRIHAGLDKRCNRARLRDTYHLLAECLATDTLFEGI